MADNNSKVNRLDPFTGLEIPEREVKTAPPVDPFTGQQITSTAPKGMGVMLPYDLPTDRGGRQSYLDKGVNLRPFADINEQRAQNQSKWEQYWNGFQNLRGIAVGTAVEGTVGLAEGLARWGSGGFKKDEFSDIWNTWTGGKVDEYKEYIRNKYPVYKTKEEQDAIGYESLGDATFWADDFMSGVGYMAGAIGGGLGAGLLLKGATKGLKYGLQAASATGKMQNVMKAMVTGTDLGTAVTATGYAKQALNAGHRFAIASSMAHAEAATEARDMMQTAYSNALEAMAEAKGVEVDDLSFADKQKARETARRLSNTGYLVNLAVLGISNTIQFGRMVYPSFNQMRPKVKGLNVRGTNVTDNLARNTAAGRFAQRLAEKEGFLQGAGTELLQEGTQFLTAETVADVARRNSDTTGIEDWTRGFGEAWSKLDSKEGLASLYLGALTGGFGGGVRTARKAIGKKYRAENLQRQMAIAALENPMTFNIATRMEAGTRSEVIGQIAKEALERGDHKGFRDAQFELLMGDVMMHEQLGTIDYMLQQLEDSKNMTKEQFAKSFGIDPEVEFDPKQIVDGLKSKIDRFLTLKRAVDTMSPGRPMGTSIGNWLTKSGRQKLSEQEKQERLEEEQYKMVLLQEAWRSQDQNRRITKLIDEINSATQGEGVTPDMMMDFLTEEEAKKAEPIKDMEELVGKKPYLSLSPEVRKKLQDRIDEIPDPIQREIIDSKRKDLEKLTADRAKAIFAMEELLRSPESRMAAMQRRQAEEDAIQEQKLNKRADEIISNSVTEDDLDEFMKSDEFDEMPESAKDKIKDARHDRMEAERKFRNAFDRMSSDDLVARLVLLQDMKEKTPQQELEQKVLESYIPYRKDNPQSYKPVTVSPEKETPPGKDTPKDKSKEKPEKIKKLAAKHTKAFKEAVDEVEKLNAAQTILNHFRMAQERGIDSFLDPDVLLEVQETINELSVQGYEIVDYAGQAYDESMPVEVELFTDETLEPGQKVIYMVRRPEIRKDGELVQTAKVLVKESPLGKGDGSSKTDVQPEQPKGGRVSMRNGEFKQIAGQVQYDEAGDPIPGVDSNLPVPIDRNFVKTPEGVKTLQEKGVEFKLSPEYESTEGGKVQAILVYVAGTDTAIGFLPSPAKDATSATVAELLKTQDSVKASVENFSFGGVGNFLQGAPHVQASTVIDLERDSIAAIGVVKESQLLYGATIEGREFGDLEIRRVTKGKGFLDGQVTMAIQYPNGQYGNVVFSTLEVGDHGIDVLKEYLQNPDGYAIDNIKARIGVPNDFVPGTSKFSLQPIKTENQTGVFTLFEYGKYVIRMDNQNLLTMISGAGRINFKVGKMAEGKGTDGRTNYTFEEDPNVDDIVKMEIGAKLLGGEYFKSLVRASKMQVDSVLLEKNPKNYTSTLGTGIKYKDYYDFLLNEVLLTDTRFIEGLPVFDVGIDFVIDEQVKPEEAVSKVKLEKPSGKKKTTTTVDEGAGKLKPKFGKRPRRGAKATTKEEAPAEEAPKNEWKVGQTVQIKYRNSNYLVTYQGVGGENKIVNQKSGKELNATSPYASKILDKWLAGEGNLVTRDQDGNDVIEESVAFSLGDKTPQDVLLDLLEKYGFEINHAEQFLVNLAAKRINLNTMSNEQIAKAMSSTLALMVEESTDISEDIEGSLRRAFQKTQEYKIRHESAKNRIRKDRAAEWVKLQERQADKKVKVTKKSFDRTTESMLDAADKNVRRDMLRELLEEGFRKELAARMGIKPSLYEKIKAFIDKVINAIRSAVSSDKAVQNIEAINDTVQKIINNSFAQGEFIRISPEKDIMKKSQNYREVNFQKAFDENETAHMIQTNLGKNDQFMLTGSIAFAAQGTAYRRADNTVHDLDYVVLGDIETAKKHLEKEFPGAEQVYDFDPNGKVRITTYVVPPGMYMVQNIQRAYDKPGDSVPPHMSWSPSKSGKVVYYEIATIPEGDKESEVVGRFFSELEYNADGTLATEHETKEGVEGMLVDLFSESQFGDEFIEQPFRGHDGKNITVKLSRFDVPFKAKLQQGRLKDLWDYNRFTPKDSAVRKRARKIDPAKAKQWIEARFGEGSAVIFDTVKKVGDAEVHGYMENAAVHLWSNAAIGTEYHEAFHMFFRTMLSDAQREALYEEALSIYGEPTAKDIAKARRGQDGISDAEARFLALEERLADDFRIAQLNKEATPKTFGQRISKFFRDLMYYIKALVTDRVGVQQAFHMLSENKIPPRFSRTAEKFSPGRAFMLRNYALDPDTHRELVDTATYLIREAATKGELNIEDALGTPQTRDIVGGESRIRDWFLEHSYHVQDDSALGFGRPLTPAEFAQLKEAYDSGDEDRLAAVEEELNLNAWAPATDRNGNPMGLGLQGFDPAQEELTGDELLISDEVIDRAEENAMEFRMVYDYWHDQFNELGGKAITGFRSDIADALKASGISVQDRLVEELDDDGADKIYTKTNFEIDPASRLGKDFKILLSTIPVENPEKGRFGFRRYMYWKDIYQEVAGTVANAENFIEMVTMLNKRGNDVSNMKHVAEWINNLPAPKQALLYAMLSQSMTEHRLIIMSQNETEVQPGQPSAVVKIINSSVSSNQRYFRELWKDQSTSIGGVYTNTLSTDGTNAVLDTQLDQQVAQRLQDYVTQFDSTNNVREKQELLARMMMDMGLTIAPSVEEAIARLQDYLSTNGIAPDEFFTNQVRHTNLRQIITQQMVPGKQTYTNVFASEGSTMDYVAREIMGRYEAPKLSSFYNAFGDLRYPLNLTTDFHLTERAIQRGDYAELMNDAVGSNVGDTSSFAHLLALDPDFREKFQIVDIEAIKIEDSSGDKIDDYKSLSYEKALAIDLAMFNRDRNERQISIDTQADRNKLSYAPVPNMKLSTARSIYGVAEFGQDYVRTIARRTYLLDLHRMYVSHGTGKIDRKIARYHEGGSLNFQLGGRLEADTLFSDNFTVMKDAYKALEYGDAESAELSRFLDTKVENFVNSLAKYKDDIVNKLGGEAAAKYFIQTMVEPKNGYVRGQEMEFLQDFVEMSVLGRLTTREFLRSGINYSKDGAAYVKRSGHSSTPGYLLALQGTLTDPEYGMPRTFREITVKDLISSISPQEFKSLRDALAKQIRTEAADAVRMGEAKYEDLTEEDREIIDRLLAPYGRNNGTDAQAFITMEMYRFIQQGLGKWDASEEKAYEEYIAMPKGQRVWKGKPIKAMKPSYDFRNAVMINGKKHLVPIVHKNSYMVLTDQVVEGIPNMMNLLNFMETNDVQVANTNTAKKLGSFEAVDITDLANANIQELDSRGLKFPQILPYKKDYTVTFGRQPRKNMIANIDPKGSYELGGVKMKGKEMIDLYLKAVKGRLEQGHAQVVERLGYDKFLLATTAEAKRQALADMIVNLRDIVTEMKMEKDFTQNFLDAIEVKADADGNVTTAVPLNFPLIAGQLENLIMSMFRNDAYLMRLPGQEMVQFAEFGAHEEDGTLKFYEVEGDRVTGAQVDIGYDVLKRMGLDPDADPEILQEGLDELLGYRIPQQSKASMYVLKIRKVLKGEHSGVIRVPAATTTLMGSDFDVDKLFVIFPEVETTYDDKGKAIKVERVRPDYKTLLKQKDELDFSTLDPKVLNNIVFDTFYSVGSDVKHLTETTAVMDLDEDVDPLVHGMKLMGRPTTVAIDINSPHERIMSAENNMLSMKLRGIYANAVAGRNVLEVLINVYGLDPVEDGQFDVFFDPPYADRPRGIRADSELANTKAYVTTKIESTDKETGEPIVKDVTMTYQTDQLLSMYLSRAVDSVNDPIQSIINDNATTAPLTVFMLSAGFTPAEAITFLNIPIVKQITDSARDQGLPVRTAMIFDYGKLGPRIPNSSLVKTRKEKGPFVKDYQVGSTMIDLPSAEEMGEIVRAHDAGENVQYDQEYYVYALYHIAQKAGRLQNYHTLINPDNIDQKGTIPLHQEMLDQGRSLRDDVFGKELGAAELIDKVIEGQDYPIIGAFYDKGALTLKVMSDLGFISDQPAVEAFKKYVKQVSDSKYLNAEQHRDINRIITHHIYTMPGSPIFDSGLLDYDFLNNIFFGGGMEAIIEGMRTAIGDSENIVFNTLKPSTEVLAEGRPYTTLKYNVASLDDLGKNQFSALLAEMIENPSMYGDEHTPTVKMFTKAVISNAIITSGFTPGAASYFNLIPGSYWNSLVNKEGEDFRTHANRAVRELRNDATLISQLGDSFLMNYGTHKMGKRYLFETRSMTSPGETISNVDTIGKIIIVRDKVTGAKYLYYLSDRETGTFRRLRTKGRQYKLNETHVRDSNGEPTQVSLITGVEGTTTLRIEGNKESNKSKDLGMLETMEKESMMDAGKKIDRLQKSFAKAGIEVDVVQGPLPKGTKGQVQGSTVTVDPEQITGDTVYHEFGHILLDMLPEDTVRGYAKNVAELRPDIAEAVRAKYTELEGLDLDKEIVTTAIGIEGARIERKNPSKFRILINRILRAIGKLFGVQPNAAAMLAEELFAGQIQKEKLVGVVSEKIRRSQALQQRVKDVVTQVTSTLKRQKLKLEAQRETETQKLKLREIDAQLNTMNEILEKTKLKQKDIEDFLDFQQYVINKTEAIENSIQYLKETEHTALTRSEIFNRLQRIDSLREDIDSLFSTNTENSAVFKMAQLVESMNFDETKSEEVQEILKDLGDAGRKLADLRVEYLGTVIPMISKMHFSYADPELARKLQKMKDTVKANKDISGYRRTSLTKSPLLKRLKQEYADRKKTDNPMSEEEYKEKALEIKLQELDNKIPGKEQLDAELRRAHLNKSAYAAAMDPIVYSSQMNVQLLATTLRDGMQAANDDVIDYVYELEKVYNPFVEFMGVFDQANVVKLNEKILTTKRVPLRDDKGNFVGYMRVLSLVEPFNTGEYYKDRKEAFDEFEKETNRPESGADPEVWTAWNRSFDAQRFLSMKKQWHADPQNSQPVKNAEAIWQGWMARVQQIDQELAMLEEEGNPKNRDKRGILFSERRALERRMRDSRYEDMGGITYMGELSMPGKKYESTKYKEIMETPELKNYYDYILKEYQKDQERIGASGLYVNAWDKYSYVMPSVRRDWVEGFLKGNLDKRKTWWNQIKEIGKGFVRLDTDTEYGIMTEVDGDKVRQLPRYFTNPVPAQDVTHDVMRSMTAFRHSAAQFEAKAKMTGLVNGMLAAYEAKGSLREDANGNPMFDVLKSLPGMDRVLARNPTDRETQHLKDWIDTVFYGEKSLEAMLGRVDLNKVSSVMQSTTAANSLMLNTLQIFNQFELDNLMAITESVAGEYWSPEDHLWAVKTYFREAAAIGDIGALAPKSKLGKAMQTFDAMVDIEEQLKRVTGSKTRKFFSPNTGYSGQRGVEHQVAGVRMLSVMSSITPLDKDGNKIEVNGKIAENLYDALIENESGRLIIDPRVANITKEKVIAKLHGIGKKTNQIKGTFDGAMANRNWFWSMLLLFRNYIPGNVRKQFGFEEGYHVDHELGMMSRGMYPSTISVARNMIDERNIADGWAMSSETDRANTKRTAMHALSIAASWALYMMFYGMAQDDDDDDMGAYTKMFMAYQMRRLQTELMGFINPFDMGRMIQRPLATSNTFLNWLEMAQHLYYSAAFKTLGWHEDSATYQRRQGSYAKGDLKLWGKLAKVVPTLNGWQTGFWRDGATKNVEEKLKWFNR